MKTTYHVTVNGSTEHEFKTIEKAKTFFDEEKAKGHSVEACEITLIGRNGCAYKELFTV